MTIPFYGSEVKFRFIAFFQLRVVKFSLKRAPIVFWAPVPYLSLYEGFSLGGKTISKESRYSPLAPHLLPFECHISPFLWLIESKPRFLLNLTSCSKYSAVYYSNNRACIFTNFSLGAEIKWSLSISMLRIQVDTKNALNWLVIISTTTSNCPALQDIWISMLCGV